MSFSLNTPSSENILCYVQIRRKLRSLEGLLQFRGNEQHISHTAHKLSIGAFALQTALDKVRPSLRFAGWVELL